MAAKAPMDVQQAAVAPTAAQLAQGATMVVQHNHYYPITAGQSSNPVVRKCTICGYRLADYNMFSTCGGCFKAAQDHWAKVRQERLQKNAANAVAQARAAQAALQPIAPDAQSTRADDDEGAPAAAAPPQNEQAEPAAPVAPDAHAAEM